MADRPTNTRTHLIGQLMPAIVLLGVSGVGLAAMLVAAVLDGSGVR
jgi:hypothetical protein